MEQTLGKRIVANRKRLGLTQDQLAEQLGITAQAVSKWENDQSCPDITILPRLAQIFGITTDALLGIETIPVREAEAVKENDGEPNGLHIQTGPLELQFGGRKSGICLAVLILLVGSLLLAGNILQWPVSFWGLLWPCAMVVYGLAGLYPGFGFIRIGCVIFGGYFLADEIGLLPAILGEEIIFSVVLVLFGLSLLADTLFRKRSRRNHHSEDRFTSSFQTTEDGFNCETSFGEDRRLIDLPRLHSGSIDCSFGELTVDLSGCAEASGSHIHIDCSFGSVTLLVPRRFRAEMATDTTFGNVEISGTPAENALPIHLHCDVSFGTVTVRYI